MVSKRFAGAIPLGLFLFFAAFPLLFWNEGRAVRTARALSEGSRNVVSLEVLSAESKNDTLLVHVSGEASSEALRDPLLGIESSAFRLRRKVEMFQWTQVTAHDEGTESWYYEANWSEELVDSRDFPVRYQNPETLPYTSETFVAEQIEIGDFQLSVDLTNKLNTFEPLNLQLTPETLAKVFNRDEVRIESNHIYLPYGSGTEAKPAIGDIRFTLEHIPLGVVSIVAQQNGNTLEPYTAHSGGTVAMIRPGRVSAQEMFDSAIKQNNAMTTFLRVFGFGLMAGGFRLLFSPLTAIAGVIPLLGGLLRFGATTVAGVLAFVLSLVTASLAWFTYRPLIAIPLLVAAVASFYLARQAGKSRPAKNVPST
jgi:hypothetical protein